MHVEDREWKKDQKRDHFLQDFQLSQAHHGVAGAIGGNVAATGSAIRLLSVSEKIEPASACLDSMNAAAIRCATTSMIARCIFAIFR